MAQLDYHNYYYDFLNDEEFVIIGSVMNKTENKTENKEEPVEPLNSTTTEVFDEIILDKQPSPVTILYDTNQETYVNTNGDTVIQCDECMNASNIFTSDNKTTYYPKQKSDTCCSKLERLLRFLLF